MNKTELIRPLAQNDEDRLLLAQVLDKLETCRERSYMTHTRFLDLRQRTLVTRLIERAGARGEAVLWGGYPDAERVCALFYPDYMTAEDACDPENAPFSLLRAEKSPSDTLSHRDYLGALMGLGLDRSVVGDILVHDGGAEILVMDDMAEYIEANFFKAGRKHISLSLAPLSALIVPEVQEIVREGSVASMRLDSVTTLIFNLSRTQTQEFIEKGLVFVNHMQVLKNEYPLHPGDRITLRGHGRARIEELGGVSRKGRQFLRYTRSQ